jgi:hypothetical protein
MMKKMRVLLAVILSLHTTYSLAIVIGSESTVSVQPLATFPAADNDNTMLGFGWFKNGFSLEDSTTTCTFDSAYPVSGPINLNSGTLYLNQDLLFKNVTTMQSLGSIIANTHSIEFCESITNFPADMRVFENANIFLATDMLLNGTVIFRGNCVLNGKTASLFMGDSGTIIVDSGSHLEIREIEIEGIKNQNIQCVDDTSVMTLGNVRWIQNGDFYFKKGSMRFFDPIRLIGPYVFSYESSQTSTILKNTTLQVTDGLSIKIGRSPITGNEPLVGEDDTAVFSLDNCTFVISISGMNLKKMTLLLNKNIDLDIQSTATETGLMVGDGTPGNDCRVYFSPSAVVNLVGGHLVFNNVDPNKIESTSATARVIRQPASLVSFHQDTVLKNLTLQLLSNFTTPLSVQSGKTLSFDQVTVVLPDIEFDITGNQYSSYAYFLGGGQEFFITKGTLPLGLVVAGADNKVRGNGGLTQPIMLTDPTASLLLGLQGFVNNTISLNGGSITLETDLQLLANGQIDGPGIFNLGDNVLRISGGMSDATTPIYFDGTNGILKLGSNITLSSIWTFSGSITIDGGGHTLELVEGSSIVIDSNSNVRFKNMRILGVQGNNISCLDDSGHFELDDVDLIQDNAYTFSTGSFNIRNKVTLLGNSTFAYASKLTSTISANAELHITDGMTLQLGKHPETLNNPLVFEDETSVLHLDNCAFNITAPGYQITNGVVFLDRNISIDMNSTSTLNGLTLGNGDPAHDATIYFSPSSVVNFNSGHLVYNNGAPDGFVSASKTARISRHEAAFVHIARNILFKNITSALASTLVSMITVSPGQTLSYDGITIVFPGAEFDIKGTQPSGVSFQLTNGDEISMLRGDFPLAVRIGGPNNIIRGNGTLLSPVIFLTPTGELTWEALGGISSYVMLSGGTLALTSDLFLAAGAVIHGPGSVNLNNRRLRLTPQSSTWDSAIYWQGSGGVVDLKAPVTLSGVWTFSGDCTLDGRGNRLILAPGGKIAVAADATLTLKDITLENVQGTNIQCLGDDSVLVLNNVIWKQTDNALFTTGSFIVSEKLKMLGSGTNFAYQSSQVSVINSESALKLDIGFTFSYDPNINAKNLLEFADFSSKLVLNGATFHATGTGVQFVGGEIDIRRNASMSSEIVGAYDEGITLGDGTSDNDCTCVITNGAQLYVTQGSLNYKNMVDTSWDMLGNQAKLRMASGTTLRVFENLNMDDGVLVLEDGTTLAVAIGMNIIGPVHPLGDVTAFEF